MHWTDPHMRGLDTPPTPIPPRPMSATSNDIGTRLARQEEHAQFMAWHIGRIEWGMSRVERESLLRARDLGTALEATARRITALEHDRTARMSAFKTMTRFGGSAASFVRYAAAVALGLGVLSGRVTIETFKVLMSALGFPLG